MALYTQSQFAEMVGKTRGFISVYVSRGKLVLNGDFIDDQHPINQLWLQKNANKVKAAPSATKEPLPEVSTRPTRPAPDQRIGKTKGSNDSYLALERERSAKELEKLELSNRLAQIKVEKAQGLLIPTELVKVMFLQHSKSITTAFQDALEDILVVLLTTHALSESDIANLRKMGVDRINLAINQAVDQSKKEVKHIAQEYSEVRSVGERT